MTDMDNHDDDIPAKKPPTREEITEYENAVRKLIRFRSPFDKQLKFLNDMLTDKERQTEKCDD